MKISLIFSPTPYQTKETMPPLGIAWIAAVLRTNGYPDVFLIDSVVNKYTNNDILKLLNAQHPDIIGLSFGTQNRFEAFALAKIIKSNFSLVPLIAGGAHPTLTADDTLQHIGAIDVVIRGEGELTFLNLVQTIEKKEDLSKVKGISYRDKDSQIHHNVNRELIADLDSLPLPARDLLPMEKYKQTIPTTNFSCTSIISSRGCPYHCVYCSTAEQWGHNIRYRSPQNVVDEIESVIKEYNLDGVGFFDDVLTINKERLINICKEIISRKLNIYWWCEDRANTIDEELVSWMKKAGCIHISMAIETGSNQILKNIKKAITVEQAVAATMIIKKAGIKLKLFFMHGLPGETYQDIKKTVWLSRDMQRRFKVEEATQTLTMIYPQTEIEHLAKEQRVIPEDF
ncbi:MAG: radical SAM protein, partial [Candidatus Falkowbacteria bacterium]|nr:radical SAM protein [Candidatus Falkowbacteria bacterium]